MCVRADGDVGAFDEAIVVLVEAERATDDGVEGEDVTEELENTRELSTTPTRDDISTYLGTFAINPGHICLHSTKCMSIGLLILLVNVQFS